MIINMAGGGGAALNFKVVPGLTQPGTAVENTIWVKTEKIGAWYFSATQPGWMQEWDVWFEIGTESDYAFNALRKNGLQVYPLSAKQMVGGTFTDLVVYIYQNAKWVLLWDGSLYKDGNQYEAVTGGWEQREDMYSGSDKNAGTVIFGDKITVSCTPNAGQTAVAATKRKISVSGYSYIDFEVDYDSSNTYAWMSLFTKNTGMTGSSEVAYAKTSPLPIPEDGGEYYIGAYSTSGTTATFGNIRLVR